MIDVEQFIIVNKEEFFLRVTPGQRVTFSAGDIETGKTVTVMKYPGREETELLFGARTFTVERGSHSQQTVRPHDDDAEYIVEILQPDERNKPITGHIKVVKTD